MYLLKLIKTHSNDLNSVLSNTLLSTRVSPLGGSTIVGLLLRNQRR